MRSVKLNNIIRFISNSITAILIFIFIGCEQAIPKQHFRPDMVVENYTTTNFKDSKIEWELRAKKASYYYSEKRSIAENIFLNYYKDNKPAAVVKADSATIYTESRDIVLSGSVDMLSTTGNRLLTTKIRWNNKDGFLDTDERIKILRKNGDVIEGIGLKADYNLEGYEIKKKVTAVTSNVNKKVNKKKNK